MSGTVLIAAPKLRELTFTMIRNGGSDEAEAAIVADHLVMANLSGHDSHGVGMMPIYLGNLQKNLLRPNTPARVVHDDGPFLQFDGDKGYGQRVAREVTEASIERARDAGVCVATLKNSHHIGRVGTYGELAAAAGFVSVHFVNVTDHRELVAPHRGSDSRFSTNPICIAMPSDNPDEPIIADMATSKVAMGKVRVAYNYGRQVEPGTLIDPQGQPTTDPGVMMQEPRGSLLTFAEHKGYALALMAELMSGALSGGGTIQPGNERLDGIINTMTMVVIDPARLGDPAWIKQEVTAMADYAKGSPPADPNLPVLVPGDPERATRLKRGGEGVPLDNQTWAQFLEAAEALDVPKGKALEIAGLA